jgi:UMF1 family MFS transporter
LYAWLTSISMAVVAAVAPFLGVLADRRGSRIVSLAACWIPGVGLTFALAGVGPGDWLGGGLVFIAAYACFAAASIFYNALLPELGPPERLGRLSGIAWGVGYVGGALLLVVNLIMLRKPALLGFADGRFTVRDCFASAAWWWLLFTLPLLWVFRYEARLSRRGDGPGFRAEAGEVLRQVRRTTRRIARTPNLRRFFLAYLLYNDGVQTVVTMASIFGAQALGMPPEQLIAFFLLIQVTAFAGSMVLGALADRAGHKPVLLVATAAWAAFTFWAAAIGIFGNAVREYWILGGAAGLFLGGIQSCSRSMIAGWIPAGRESEFFGFFSIMSRVASIFGPLLYGGLVLATGSLRRAILSVTVFFLAGGILLAGVRPGRIEEEREGLAADEE